MNASQPLAVAATGRGSSGAAVAASRASPFLSAVRGCSATGDNAAPAVAAQVVRPIAALAVRALAVFVALATAQVALPAEPAGSGKSATQNVGQLTYEKWCAPCHAPGPQHPGTQALDALYKGSKPAALIQRSDLTPPIVKQFVRTGVSVMPFFRKTEISDAELDALAAFLSKQK